MNNPDIKNLLTENTDRSFKSGAFGLPWFECTNSKGETEGFWGVDHIGQVADFLGLDRSLDKGFRAAL
jgi:2-hydroxychromene-2-carboxylate isomerase